MSESPTKPVTAFGPKPLDSTTAEWVGLALERIARAANLKRLAANESEETPRGDAVRIELQIERDGTSLPMGLTDRPTLRDGDKITIVDPPKH